MTLLLNLMLAGVLAVISAFDPTGITLYLGMAVVDGTRGTGNILAGSRVVDMSNRIALLDPNMAPLTSLSMRLRKKHCINPQFQWLEDEYLPSFDQVNGTVVTAATSVVVDNGTYFRIGDVVKVMDSGEVLLVTNVVTNTLTVTRAIGSTAAAQIADNGQLLIIGNANEEGATARAIKSQQQVAQSNYAQILRRPFGVTETERNSELYGGDDLAWQGKVGGKMHLIDIERAFLFGEKRELTTGTHPRRFTGGVIERITTNVTTLATLTASTWETFLRSGFRYGSSRKFFFGSRMILSFLSELAYNKIEMRPEDQSMGIAIRRWNSPHGVVYLVTHNLLEAGPAGVGGNNQAYQGWGALLDLDAVYYRYLRNRDTRVKTNIQANDADERKDEFLTECGQQVFHEKQHAIIRNVSAVA